jgi:hypothetical protein
MANWPVSGRKEMTMKGTLIMKAAVSLLIFPFVFNFVAVAHVRGQPYGKAGTAAQQSTTVTNSENDIPKPVIKTIDDPGKIVWDYMIWTDSTGNFKVQAKVLSIDGKEVRLEKEGGAILKIAIEKFCKADRELLTDAYEAESEMQPGQTDRERFREDVKKALEVPANETAIRKQSIREAKQEAFLKSYNGKDICLRFPIKDIEPALSRRHPKEGDLVIPGIYQLSLEGKEASYGLLDWNGSGASQQVRLSASEAAWVSKGDCLTIRGKATFKFGDRPPGVRVCFSFLSLCLVLEKPEYAIVRSKHNSSLNDKIKARAAAEGDGKAGRGPSREVVGKGGANTQKQEPVQAKTNPPLGTTTFAYTTKEGKRGQFTNLGGKDWMEVTGEGRRFAFTEVRRGNDLVELTDRGRDVSVRISSDRYEFKVGPRGKWESACGGSWLPGKDSSTASKTVRDNPD